ncbi:PREDICTED: fatty-acid amide hydrolase 2-like, partial [Rhagoletis zephyria]|uniref:fatty-acid amide hydrolase 2-like n=1 Tax=Rhagoletis zephyria TaxID=28612 RepID=UPI00081150C9
MCANLKSEDLVQAYVDRCRAINPLLNAIVDENYERALEEARAVDERVARELRREKRPEELSVAEYPFLGVPFTTKNSIAVAGLTYSGGITARRGVTAERDAVAIDRMKKLGGAIFLGVTNVPEAVMWLDGFNLVDGQTNNPYDQSRIPGGSSAGEGAIIAGAGSVIGVGSDIGGSIRIPAHFCGIFGHKTTPTAVDPTGVWPPFASKRIQLLSLGPMTRFAVDLRPMLKVLVGEQRLELPERPLNFSTLNVYYMLKIDDPFVTPVDVEIEQGLDTVIRFFIEHGSRTIPLDTAHKFHDLRYALFLWCTAMNDPNNPSYLNLLTEGRRAAINPYWELLKCMVGRNKEYTAAILTLGISEELGFTSGEVKKDVYEAMLERLKKDLHELLSTDGVLICPTFPEI